MPINFKEFRVYPGFTESHNSQNVLPAAAEALNEWLAQNPVRVINVESLTTPINDGLTGTVTRYWGIRAWYDEA